MIMDVHPKILYREKKFGNFVDLFDGENFGNFVDLFDSENLLCRKFKLVFLVVEMSKTHSFNVSYKL